MEHVGCKPPEDLGPNISVVKPTVAKFLLRLPKPGKSPAVLWIALQWGRLALKLPYAKQTAPAVSSFFLRHTASLLLFRSRLSSYANSHSYALGDGFVRRFVWQIHRYTTGSHPRELPSIVRSLPHSIAGFTSWWHFIFFFLRYLKVTPFVMHCAKLELLAVCWGWEDMRYRSMQRFSSVAL